MTETVGIFHMATDPTHVDFLDKQKRDRLKEIGPFFTVDRARKLLVPFLAMDAAVSLRHLDHLVTEQSRSHGTAWRHHFQDGQVAIVPLHESYRTWLRTWKRRLFDCFRRHERVYFQVDGVWHETTPAQLNFFYFCNRFGVLEYAQKNRDAIDRSMREFNRGRRAERRQRHERVKHGEPADTTAAFQVFMGECHVQF